MQRIFVILVCIVGLFSFPKISASAEVLTTVDGQTLEALMRDGKPLVIVDVREPDEFAAGHIPGAINIPDDEARSRVLNELSTTDRIVFVCHSGPMGDRLGKLLAANGYPAVHNLKGGMKKWKGPISR